MFATNFEGRGINQARAGSPRNHFLSRSVADLEIVIEESSWIHRHAFLAFAHILNREIREFDFLTWPIFHTRPVRGFLFRRGTLATNRPSKSQQTAQQEGETRIICHAQEVCELFGKDGSESSIATQGNLSSSQIALCGANGEGSSSDAIVTSIVSESLVSSINKCVPQHAAKERIRFAWAILRGSHFVTTRSSRGTAPQVT